MFSLNEIRQLFLNYFKTNDHTIVPSSSLVPINDNSLLFTNAGMNQFKDYFLGKEKAPYQQAVSVQKCMRAGGKHNDLENVGYTARHHTFFEMLGNFSFGSYFKETAIKYAWDFLTIVLKIPVERLYVTVHHNDDESYHIWLEQIKLNTDHIIRIYDKADGSSDNFWQMGDTGPCGPCTEIFYDHGDQVKGLLPSSTNEDGDRYVEIWNCVFMQFNKDQTGALLPLPQKAVDTGMGLERISAVMQHVQSNYEIDLFKQLINSAAIITHCQQIDNPSLKVLADHIRAVCFLIADGVLPDNEGRGYVLRRIIRRAIRHGYKLGVRQSFFYLLVTPLVQVMADSYPELLTAKDLIIRQTQQEEEKFFITIDSGMKLLADYLKQYQQLPGAIAFKLYDTYGFPLDLTQDICREHNIDIVIADFDTEMAKQKLLAKNNAKLKNSASFQLLYSGSDTEFVGYQQLQVSATVTALYNKQGEKQTSLELGEEGIIILDRTVCYSEGGGQVGDSGMIAHVTWAFQISDTQKFNNIIAHIGQIVKGRAISNDCVNVSYDLVKRQGASCNHSVTHLLHSALRQILGRELSQKGSFVCSDYLRFDFSYNDNISDEQQRQIELLVNQAIINNYQVTISDTTYDEAVASGVLALFSDKYTARVRVIRMGDFSAELCGGTHVKYTGEIGLFVIVAQSSIASGIKRIEAITGRAAILYIQKQNHLLNQMRILLKAQNNDILVEKLNDALNNQQQLSREMRQLESKMLGSQVDAALAKGQLLVNGVTLVMIDQLQLLPKQALDFSKQLKIKCVTPAIFIIITKSANNLLHITVARSQFTAISAKDIVTALVNAFNGRGGGGHDFAQLTINKLINSTVAIENKIAEVRVVIEKFITLE